MNLKDGCWNNAVLDSFFETIKTERTLLASYKTRNVTKQDIIVIIEMFCNSKRSHSYLNYVALWNLS